MQALKRKAALAVFTLLSVLLLASGCDAGEGSARDKTAKAQQTLMDRAVASVPVPQVTNFLNREAVSKQVRRLDEKGKLFYVYLMGNNGQTIGYYVSNTRPVATCSLLTPPDEVWTGYDGRSQRMTAPSLGGTYSPGASCSGSFFFDAETDAYIEISGLNYFVADQPLSIDAEPIKVTKAQ